MNQRKTIGTTAKKVTSRRTMTSLKTPPKSHKDHRKTNKKGKIGSGKELQAQKKKSVSGKAATKQGSDSESLDDNEEEDDEEEDDEEQDHLKLVRTRAKPIRNARAGAVRSKHPRKESACAQRSRPRTVVLVTQRTMQKITPAPQVLSGMPRGDAIRSIVSRDVS